jgi:hypothetical protein
MNAKNHVVKNLNEALSLKPNFDTKLFQNTVDEPNANAAHIAKSA